MKTEQEIKDKLIEWKKEYKKYNGEIVMHGMISAAICSLEWVLDNDYPIPPKGRVLREGEEPKR